MSFFSASDLAYLQAQINSEITSNGNQEISGQDLRDLLLDIISRIDGSGNASSPIDLPITTNGSYQLAAQTMLTRIVIMTSTTQNVKVGESASAGEYFDESVTANMPVVLDLGLFDLNIKTIYFTAISCNLKIYIE